MNTSITALKLVALVLATQACGSNSKQSSPPPTVYGSSTVAGSKAGTDDGTFQLTSADSCSRNVDTGLVTVSLSQGDGKPSLSFAIKDYDSTPKTYTCKQSPDNTSSLTDVGSKYQSCMVQASAPSATGAATLNAYSMYRETPATKPFSYTGACLIVVTASTPAIVGTVDCKNMVQTTLQGTARNPIDPTVTADVSATFNCTFH